MNPSATRKLLEAIWAHHVRDWGKLDFDRHGYNIHRSDGPRPRWDHDFIEDLEVPFLSERRGGWRS